MKVLLSCPVNSHTGFGRDGIELAQELVKWGVDLYLHPTSISAPLPPDVAVLLTKSLPRRVDLLISHRCPQELARGPESAGLVAESGLSIAWTMWEWRSLSNVDVIDQNNCEHSAQVLPVLREALSHFDVVFAYDEVSREALSEHCDAVSVLQGGVTPLSAMARDTLAASPFRFLMVGALTARKNPHAAVEAFRALRGAGELADAQLVLKTNRPGLHPAMEQWTPGLKIINQVWSMSEIHALYANCHALLAPSWGEGKNRPALEFATSGGAVAATHVGGHAQWLSSEYAWPLRSSWEMTSPGALGAVVDLAHLQETMLELYVNRQETVRRGHVASRVLPNMVSWEKVLERLCEKLRVQGGPAEEASVLMKSCRRAETAVSSEERLLGNRSSFDGIV